jgi:hypothetical protein
VKQDLLDSLPMMGSINMQANNGSGYNADTLDTVIHNQHPHLKDNRYGDKTIDYNLNERIESTIDPYQSLNAH